MDAATVAVFIFPTIVLYQVKHRTFLRDMSAPAIYNVVYVVYIHLGN